MKTVATQVALGALLLSAAQVAQAAPANSKRQANDSGAQAPATEAERIARNEFCHAFVASAGQFEDAEVFDFDEGVAVIEQSAREWPADVPFVEGELARDQTGIESAQNPALNKRFLPLIPIITSFFGGGGQQQPPAPPQKRSDVQAAEHEKRAFPLIPIIGSFLLGSLGAGGTAGGASAGQPPAKRDESVQPEKRFLMLLPILQNFLGGGGQQQKRDVAALNKRLLPLLPFIQNLIGGGQPSAPAKRDATPVHQEKRFLALLPIIQSFLGGGGQQKRDLEDVPNDPGMQELIDEAQFLSMPDPAVEAELEGLSPEERTARAQAAVERIRAEPGYAGCLQLQEVRVGEQQLTFQNA